MSVEKSFADACTEAFRASVNREVSVFDAKNAMARAMGSALANVVLDGGGAQDVKRVEKLYVGLQKVFAAQWADRGMV